MFLTLVCGECDTTLKIDFEKYSQRVIADPFKDVYLSCPACGNELPERILTRINNLSNDFSKLNPSWKIAFELKDAKTLNDTP